MRCAALAFAFAAALGQAAERAPDYPVRPIRVVIPGPAAGPADIVARALGESLGEALGALVYDKRAGAAGMIGAETVARATPDGYTLLISHSGPLDLGPLLTKTPPFDPIKDFTPITMPVLMPMLLLVNPGLGATNVKELIATAKSRPGKLNYASGGAGTGIHMAAEMLKLAANVNIVHVPYKGATPGLTALMSGEVDMMFNGLPTSFAAVKSGKVRALAVAGSHRTPLLPELPTIAESGGFAFDYSGWYAVLAPQGLPKPIAAKIYSATQQALQSSAMRERARTLGLEIVGSTPEELVAYMRKARDKMAKVIVATGMKPE
jgi:tripartite-type tricarboxylate transporter receptor subunit TctC